MLGVFATVMLSSNIQGGVVSHVFLPDWFHGIRYTAIPLGFHTHFGNASILQKVAVGRKAVSVQFCFVDLNRAFLTHSHPVLKRLLASGKEMLIENRYLYCVRYIRKASGTFLMPPHGLWRHVSLFPKLEAC